MTDRLTDYGAAGAMGWSAKGAPDTSAVTRLDERLDGCSDRFGSDSGRLGEYAELKRLVSEAGLLRPRPLYSAMTVARTAALLAIGMIALPFLGHLWLRLLDAAFLAFVFTHIAFVGHDSGHGQIARGGWKRDLVGLLHGNLLLGVSADWWLQKHNAHHGHPNQLDRDPDIDMPILAFSEQQAEHMRGVGRLITRYQAYFFLPLLTLEGFSLKFDSVHFLVAQGSKARLPETCLLIAHFAWYGGLLVAILGVWQAALFIVVHQALFGLYMGSVFAPNHKGMPVLPADSDLNFLRLQVLTARNVRGHAVVDFLYGGLNYQIEHHLFPTMSRSNLKAAQRITQRFCALRSIDYHETGFFASYKEVLRHLHHVGAPLRKSAAQG
jgi:fatty acid desaturase